MSLSSLYKVLAIIGLFSTSIFSQPLNDSLIGTWRLEDSTAMFDFFRTGSEYRARLIAIAKPDMIDTKNPVDSLRGRKVDGAILVYGLIYDAKKNRWDDGRVYNPEDGRTYFCNCKTSPDGKKLFFRGYLGISLLGGTQTWIRTPDNRP